MRRILKGIERTGVLKGYYAIKKEDNLWIFMKPKLPIDLENDPLEGMQFKEPKIDEYKGTIHIHFYDDRWFTRCVSDWRQYLPDIKPPKGIIDILVCLYPVQGSIPNARVQRIIINPELISIDDAIEWAKSNHLITWKHKQIRKKRNRYLDYI